MIIGLHIFQVLSRVRARACACACACLHRRPCRPPFVELFSLKRLLAVLLLASLCNAWVLSCQHQLQILACGAAHRSPGRMARAFPRKIHRVRLRPGHVAVQVNRRVQGCCHICCGYALNPAEARPGGSIQDIGRGESAQNRDLINF